jgi:hypothetical protein
VSDTPTGPWVEPMIRAKATDPRNGLPSWNQLGILAGLSTSTVTAMVSGSRKTSSRSIQAVAKVLREDPKTVSEWLELQRPVHRSYQPPPEADLLTERQQKALTSLIRAIVSDDPKAGNDSGTSAQKIDIVRDEGVDINLPRAIQKKTPLRKGPEESGH